MSRLLKRLVFFAMYSTKRNVISHTPKAESWWKKAIFQFYTTKQYNPSRKTWERENWNTHGCLSALRDKKIAEKIVLNSSLPYQSIEKPQFSEPKGSHYIFSSSARFLNQKLFLGKHTHFQSFHEFHERLPQGHSRLV